MTKWWRPDTISDGNLQSATKISMLNQGELTKFTSIYGGKRENPTLDYVMSPNFGDNSVTYSSMKN